VAPTNMKFHHTPWLGVQFVEMLVKLVND